MTRRKRLKELPLKAAKDFETGHERPVQPTKKTVAELEGQSPGRRLRAEERREMERLLGADFGSVRIHDDAASARSADALNATAYVRGRDLYFGRPLSVPLSTESLELLAHELAHSLQTGGRDGGAASHADLESEADRVAAAARRGEPVTVSQRAPGAGPLRKEKEGDAAPPTVALHPHEITPGQGRGTIQAGSFSVSFRYETAGDGEQITLFVVIPDGVEASFSVLNQVPEGDVDVDAPGGTAARTVRLSAASGSGTVPRIRGRFSKGSATCIVVFQLSG